MVSYTGLALVEKGEGDVHCLLIIDYVLIYVLLIYNINIFHSYRDVTIASEGMQSLGLCSMFIRRLHLGIDCATPAVTWGLGFFGGLNR